ncbi:hypothetical protein [Lutibacter sp.]
MEESFIQLQTNHEGIFKVTIELVNGVVIFSELITSHNKKITLKGFSLKIHTVVISPINTKYHETNF